jgi:pyruvate dehydrogenase E2 component (dihydrolipoamide acetyltransferase)
MPVDVLVPPLGATVDILTLVSWYKQEGETVVKDEPLFAVETDKATLDVEAPASGILCRVSAEPGAEVAALSRIALIRNPNEPDDEINANAAPNGIHSASISAPATAPSPTQHTTRQQSGTRIFISPRAKRLAEANQLDWRVVSGTGPEGAILERDILAQQATARPKTVSPVAQRMAESAGVDWTQVSGSGAGGKVVREDINRVLTPENEPAIPSSPQKNSTADILETIPLTGIRGTIAARMMQSVQSTAPVTLTAQSDATALVHLRAQLADDGLTVSYNALLLKILARALREHPHLNASIQNDAIQVWRNVHIGLAVEGENGLRVPVVRDVMSKGLEEIEGDIRLLISSARDGKILPDAMRGGTFTLTNLGMYGIAAFTPVINLPECAILGVGQIKPEPSVINDQLAIRQKMWLSLTFDHRLVDGAPAARFLQRVVQLIEKPHLLHS